MIVRIFRVVIYEEKIEEFKSFMLDTAMPLMRRQKGLVSIQPCLPRPETPTEFCLVMVWETLDALVGFAGEDWQRPHIHPDEKGIVRERFLHHYELASV